MKDATLDLLITSLIRDFEEFQVALLTSHNDIEFCPEEERLIVDFLHDTAECYISDHVDDGDV